MSEPTTRCYSYQGVHIPGCSGCGYMGSHRYCTCPPRPAKERPDPIEVRLRAIESRLDALLVMPEAPTDE